MALADDHHQLFDRAVWTVDYLIRERFHGVDHTATDDTDTGHSRVERRKDYATDQVNWLTAGQRAEWAGLRPVVAIDATR